jgi:hypothetical protein
MIQHEHDFLEQVRFHFFLHKENETTFLDITFQRKFIFYFSLHKENDAT